MTPNQFLSIALFFSLAISAMAETESLTADAIVYGDSPSAVSAAIELSNSGHDVLLVSPVPHIGGITIEGLGSQDIDRRSGNGEPIGGLAAEFFLRIGKAYDPGKETPRYKFNSSVAERVIDEWLEETNVRVIRGKRISEAPGAVSTSDGKITGFVCEDGTRVTGKLFIDGTVEGDLMAFSGVTHTWGREGNAKYGETVGGILNPTQKQQYKVTVDPYRIPGDPTSGLIPGVQEGEIGNHGDPDQSAMGFCLRLPLTKDPSNQIPITAPEGYDPADYELYRRFLAAGGINDWLDGPGKKDSNPTTKLIDLGSWHELSGNLYGRNHDYPNGSYATRAAIYEEHRRFTQGLIYYLSNDPSVPPAIREEWSRWGLCADEFIDNGGWPRMLYLRSTRRMISDYIITEADVIERQKGELKPAPPVNDPIGICWWPVDLHAARTLVKNGQVYNEGAYIDYSNYKPFGIPYRSIVPKREDCTNLLVPSALSSSYAGYGAVRLEWTFMVLGQSAGAAAAIALDRNLPVQDVPYEELRDTLLARGQKLAPMIESPVEGEIIVDNTAAELTGEWFSSTRYPGFHGTDYLHDGNEKTAAKSIRFTPDLPEAGTYAVYTRWNTNTPRAQSVPIEITHSGGTTRLTVNQQTKGNAWNLLGTYAFSAGTKGGVLIRTDGTSGYVIADAVRFVPKQ